MVYFNTIKRLIKNQTDKLSTEEAAREIKNELERYGEQLVEESNDLAEHAERKTIQKKDVEKAIDKINQ